MAKLMVLGEAVSLTAAAAQTAVQANATPFAPGFNGVLTVHTAGATGTPTIKVQGSDDNVTFTDVLTVTSITGLIKRAEITLSKYMRLNVTVVGTAGTVAAYIED